MPDKPNILVIWGDDIGITNLSCYSDGLMGYRTPNIDRIAHEGMRFTDSYGEQSCTAGRSSFITGQSVFRTGLSKVGVPGSPIGLQPEDPTIAELLKPLGTRPDSSARTTSVIGTSSSRPSTASTSSSGTSTT
jgi:arylsulfatase A-like enzyme